MPILEEINRTIDNFSFLTCNHIYRERNTTYANLSKEGLNMNQGLWNIIEQRDAQVYEFFLRAYRDFPQGTTIV